MAEHWWICFFVYLFTDRCMQSWNAAFFFIIGYSLWGGGHISGSGSKFNCAAWVGSGQTISGSGFNFKPEQTSSQA